MVWDGFRVPEIRIRACRRQTKSHPEGGLCSRYPGILFGDGLAAVIALAAALLAGLDQIVVADDFVVVVAGDE